MEWVFNKICEIQGYIGIKMEMFMKEIILMIEEMDKVGERF